MTVASIVAHIFTIPHFVIGAAMVRWNKRVADAMVKSQTAFYEALGVKFLARLSARMHHPVYVRGIVVVVGTIFTVVGLAGIIFGAGGG